MPTESALSSAPEQGSDSRRTRLLGVVLPALVLTAIAATVTACGQDTYGVATTVVPVQPTNFATIPPVASTLPGTTTTLQPGAVGQEQTYTVQAGDSPSLVAARYNISLTALLAYNGWVSAQQFPYPGTTILIPPEATSGGGGGGGSTQSSLNNTLLVNCSNPTRPAGTYKVVSGDSFYKLMKRFCISEGAFLNANGWNSPSTAFLGLGQTINVPAAGQ